MGGLSNGRRGGRSPPLLIGALIACILVLGFNYWVSSSRSLELQTKLFELEGQVRRGVAERGAVEVKKKEFQEEIHRQKEQIARIENLYKKQLEGAQNACIQERGVLQLNISISAQTIQDLRAQLNQLNDDLGKAEKDRRSCLSDVNSLNKKLTYETTQCNTQILAQIEHCDEKVAAARLEVQKKMEKLTPPGSPQGKAPPTPKSGSAEKVGVTDQEEGPGKAGLDDTKTPLVLGPAPKPSQPKMVAEEPEDSELLTNEIAAHKDARAEDALIGQQKGEQAPIGRTLDEPEDYDADEQIVGGSDLEKQNQLTEKMDAAREFEDELADYNGDDDNEGEFEADKQVELQT